MKFIFFALIGLASSVGFASLPTTMNLEGYVVRFDEKTVVVESGKNNVEVPRKLYPQKVKQGDYISFAIDDAQLSNLKMTPVKTTKK